MNVQIKWVMTRELIYWHTNWCGLPVNKLWTAIINHHRMPCMANFLLLCSNKIVLKTGSSFSWCKDFDGLHHRWHHKTSVGDRDSTVLVIGIDHLTSESLKQESSYTIPLNSIATTRLRDSDITSRTEPLPVLRQACLVLFWCILPPKNFFNTFGIFHNQYNG